MNTHLPDRKNLKELNQFLEAHPDMVNALCPTGYPAIPPKGSLYEKDLAHTISQTHKDVASEFLFPLNDNWRTPRNISAGCNKYAVFRCKQCGRVWATQISTRCLAKCGCPECSKALIKAEGKRKATPKQGEDLESKCSLVVKVWDYEQNNKLGITPKDVKYRSNRHANWVCPVCGNHWSASINSMYRSLSSGTYGCPKCRNRASVKSKTTPDIGVNDLESKCPDVVKVWDYEQNDCLPKDVKYKSNKSVNWKCPTCGHKWSAPIYSMYNSLSHGKTGCIKCRQTASVAARTRPKHGEDLGSLYPKLAEEWDSENNTLTPNDYMPHSNKKVHWICSKCGARWSAQINSRVRGNGCPKCSSHLHTSLKEYAIYYYLKKIDERIFTGVYLYDLIPNLSRRDRFQVDILIPDRKIAIEYDGFIFHNTKQSKERERKKDGLLLSAEYRVIRVKETRDSRHDVFLSDDDIIRYSHEDDYADLNKVIQLLALEIYGKNLNDIDFRRDEEKIQQLRLGKYIKNSVAVMKPELAKEWSPNNLLTAWQVPYGSDTKYKWICPIHGEYEASPANRYLGKGCPKCAHKCVVVGENNIGHTNPELMEYWDYERNDKLGITPDNITVHTQSCGKIHWKCPHCGTTWEAAPYTMKQRIRKCLNCGEIPSHIDESEK